MGVVWKWHTDGSYRPLPPPRLCACGKPVEVIASNYQRLLQDFVGCQRCRPEWAWSGKVRVSEVTEETYAPVFTPELHDPAYYRLKNRRRLVGGELQSPHLPIWRGSGKTDGYCLVRKDTQLSSYLHSLLLPAPTQPFRRYLAYVPIDSRVRPEKVTTMPEKQLHRLKTLSTYWDAVREGVKTFEVRKNDRLFKVGDTLILERWEGEGANYKPTPFVSDGTTYRELHAEVTYILPGDQFGIEEGYCVMAIKVIKIPYEVTDEN